MYEIINFRMVLIPIPNDSNLIIKYRKLLPRITLIRVKKLMTVLSCLLLVFFDTHQRRISIKYSIKMSMSSNIKKKLSQKRPLTISPLIFSLLHNAIAALSKWHDTSIDNFPYGTRDDTEPGGVAEWSIFRFFSREKDRHTTSSIGKVAASRSLFAGPLYNFGVVRLAMLLLVADKLTFPEVVRFHRHVKR